MATTSRRIDNLSLHWRLALDAAQTALLAAPGVLPDELLRGRLSRLNEERAETAQLLEGLARDLQVDAWLSDLRTPRIHSTSTVPSSKNSRAPTTSASSHQVLSGRAEVEHRSLTRASTATQPWGPASTGFRSSSATSG
jgi:hypothetical protein